MEKEREKRIMENIFIYDKHIDWSNILQKAELINDLREVYRKKLEGIENVDYMICIGNSGMLLGAILYSIFNCGLIKVYDIEECINGEYICCKDFKIEKNIIKSGDRVIIITAFNNLEDRLDMVHRFIEECGAIVLTQCTLVRRVLKKNKK